MTRSNLQKSEQTDNDQVQIEKVDKTAYDLICNRINNNFIVKSSDPVLLECFGLAIKQHLDTMPSELKTEFQQMLIDIKARKAKLAVTMMSRKVDDA